MKCWRPCKKGFNGQSQQKESKKEHKALVSWSPVNAWWTFSIVWQIFCLLISKNHKSLQLRGKRWCFAVVNALEEARLGLKGDLHAGLTVPALPLSFEYLARWVNFLHTLVGLTLKITLLRSMYGDMAKSSIGALSSETWFVLVKMV